MQLLPNEIGRISGFAIAHDEAQFSRGTGLMLIRGAMSGREVRGRSARTKCTRTVDVIGQRPTRMFVYVSLEFGIPEASISHSIERAGSVAVAQMKSSRLRGVAKRR